MKLIGRERKAKDGKNLLKIKCALYLGDLGGGMHVLNGMKIYNFHLITSLVGHTG